MDIYPDSIRALSPADKLLLVERIWDDLASGSQSLPLPAWAVQEAIRRRDEMMADPSLGASHEQVWKRISDTRRG